ncbi:MAG: hypothetical protein M3O70_08945 [Actinomycetota bacterium]|nr:hypothetical protein [Actinomycetota bacterium]
MSWRVAKSLNVLLDEVNRARPRRDKRSDGSIGDAAHASRSSDHNPWVKDSKGVGVVTARDFDEDGDEQVGAMVLRATVGRRDPRVKYVIYEAKIWRSYPKPGIPAWTPSAYNGPNAHKSHIHVSVRSDQRLYDSIASWGIAAGAPAPAPRVEDDDMICKHGDSGNSARVRYAQKTIAEARASLGATDGLPKIDGDYGNGTAEKLSEAMLHLAGDAHDGRTYGAYEDGVCRSAATWKQLEDRVTRHEAKPHGAAAGPHEHKATVEVTVR